MMVHKFRALLVSDILLAIMYKILRDIWGQSMEIHTKHVKIESKPLVCVYKCLVNITCHIRNTQKLKI